LSKSNFINRIQDSGFFADNKAERKAIIETLDYIFNVKLKDTQYNTTEKSQLQYIKDFLTSTIEQDYEFFSSSTILDMLNYS
jgi:hypothetical protein